MIALTHEPIDTEELLRTVADNRAGAVVLFLGTTRDVTGSRHTQSLDYECYPELATAKLSELVQMARDQWPIVNVGVIHRLGHLLPGEASVAVAVSTAHRRDAFEAAQWLMDQLKEVVPIWKKENWSDGSSEWVHPGTN